MAYSDFTLERVAPAFGIMLREEELFPVIARAVVPAWLRETLAMGERFALNSEKARSEFIVAPILMAIGSISEFPMSIYSGQRLDIDAARGLTGECDFILSAASPLPILRAPIATIVEAKKHDIEGGLGQCVAQMIAAGMFNEAAGMKPSAVYGCVTSGQVWRFLQLAGNVVRIDRMSYFLDDLGSILGIILGIIAQAQAPHSDAHPPAPSIP